MTSTSETVAIIGVGTMGHGMASSALRVGIPTVVWDRTPEATRDLSERGAEVARERGRRGAASRDRRHDGARRRRGRRERQRRWHAGGSRSRLDLGADEHDRRGRYRARHGARRCGASRHHARRRARLGQQGPGRARRADDLCVGARRCPGAGHSPLRRARSPDALGRAGRRRHARESREQHVACVRGRSGRRVGRARAPAGSRHPDDRRRTRGGTARVSVAIGQARNGS